MGAWIEMPKQPINETLVSVAPLVGAWIEIYEGTEIELEVNVAPLVGAWIEIADADEEKHPKRASLLSWERGLKFG